MNAVRKKIQEPHAIKLEDLDMDKTYADNIIEVLKDYCHVVAACGGSTTTNNNEWQTCFVNCFKNAATAACSDIPQSVEDTAQICAATATAASNGDKIAQIMCQ